MRAYSTFSACFLIALSYTLSPFSLFLSVALYCPFSLCIFLFSISFSLSSFISCSVPFHSHPLFHHLFQPLMKEVEIDGRGGGLVVNILAFNSFCIPLSVLLSYSIFLTFLSHFLSLSHRLNLFLSLLFSLCLSLSFRKQKFFSRSDTQKKHSHVFLFFDHLKKSLLHSK